MQATKFVMLGTATMDHLREFAAAVRSEGLPYEGKGYLLFVSPISFAELSKDPAFDKCYETDEHGDYTRVLIGGLDLRVKLEFPSDAVPFFAGEAERVVRAVACSWNGHHSGDDSYDKPKPIVMPLIEAERAVRIEGTRLPDGPAFSQEARDALREHKAIKVPLVRSMRDARALAVALQTSGIRAANDGMFHLYCGQEQATALHEDFDFQRQNQSIPDYTRDRESAFAAFVGLGLAFHYAKPKDARVPEFTLGAFGIPSRKEDAESRVAELERDLAEARQLLKDLGHVEA